MWKENIAEELSWWDFGKKISDPTQNIHLSKFSFNLLAGSISLPYKDYPHLKAHVFGVYLLILEMINSFYLSRN